jgi:hypothetical protein
MEVVYLSAGGSKYTKRGSTLANYLVKWVPRGITITTIRPQVCHQEDLEQAG